MTKQKSKERSLVDFVQEKRRSACTVCSLSSEVRQQLRTASAKKIDRPTVLEWLASEGQKITGVALTAHRNGHHEETT